MEVDHDDLQPELTFCDESNSIDFIKPYLEIVHYQVKNTDAVITLPQFSPEEEPGSHVAIEIIHGRSMNAPMHFFTIVYKITPLWNL